jgi:hypothetical protein
MRRVHLRGRENIWKRLLMHVAGFNLGLVMRRLWRVGTPRSLQDLAGRVWGALLDLIRAASGWPWPSGLPELRQALGALSTGLLKRRFTE